LKQAIERSNGITNIIRVWGMGMKREVEIEAKRERGKKERDFGEDIP